MCGIAGYSLSSASSVHRTLAAQALLAGIAERGADAVGYAHREAGRPILVHKQLSGASGLLDHIRVPAAATQVLVHVRDYTKGHPAIEANNHPIRHGAVVGIHNGVVVNDDDLLARHGLEREQPEMTVDSEAIFALVEAHGCRADVLEQLHGAMATAWLDERTPTTLFLARGAHRPLWIGTASNELFFASTREALEVVESTLGKTLRKREIPEGTILRVEDGKIVGRERFGADRSFVEEHVLPAVRSPDEGELCLGRIAAIVAAAA